jgi:hypothetical protein
MTHPDEPGSKPGNAVSLGDEKKVIEVVSASIQSLWEAVNNLTRLQPTVRDRYRVTIFGSARVPKDHWVYLAVRDLATELTILDCDIVTGGGPGLMEAANEGPTLPIRKAAGLQSGSASSFPSSRT